MVSAFVLYERDKWPAVVAHLAECPATTSGYRGVHKETQSALGPGGGWWRTQSGQTGLRRVAQGVKTNVSHVFAECLSHMCEGRTDIRGNGVDLLRKFSDQTGKKRDRVFRRSFNHLPVSEFGDLLDNEQDRNAEAAQVHMISGNFKKEWPRQADAREGRTDVSPTNFTEPIPP